MGQDTAADKERFVHEAFLNTHNSSNFPANYPSDYANVTAAQCELVDFDILLMEGFICHVCLPEPCKNGGQCAHHPGVYTSGGFSCECLCELYRPRSMRVVYRSQVGLQ